MKEAKNVILLVEDDQNDVFFMEHALQEAGIENHLQVVTDGQQAMDYLIGTGQFADRERFPFPSLIFLDLKLPYRSGLQILDWMRQKGYLSRTVVAVLTGSNEANDRETAYGLGAKAYLVKPPTPKMIEGIARELNLHWFRYNPTSPAAQRQNNL